jgi:xanthine dehydrogenase YagR molybdenum-binding subunit
MKAVGIARPRIDAPLKTTGTAMYASDHHFPGLLYAVPLGSTVANGNIEGMDTSKAEKMPGVVAIFHRTNLQKIFRTAPDTDFTAYMDEHRPAFEDDVIRYYGQYVALAVAGTFEQATAAANAIRVTYKSEKPNVAKDLGLGRVKPDVAPKTVSERGDIDKAFASAPVKIDQVYETPPETHAVIELHSTVAVWEGNNVTLYESTQAIQNHKKVLAQLLGIPFENVRVISKFLGSGFGGKLFPWPHCALAATAARELSRPVKLVLSRQDTFETAGHRPQTQQRVRLGANTDGKLVAFGHDFANHSSITESYEESCAEATTYLYSVPNLKAAGSIVKRNIGTPCAMRGPGAVPGLFATETAMDELAIALNMDPVQLRTLNEPKMDEDKKLPFSSRHIVECYTEGAKQFGWDKRNPKVGSMKRGGLTLGWGMAACSWIAERFPAEATVELRDDGTVRVACGTQDIGTGTYTVLAQVTAEKLGVPVEKVDVVLGDSQLPPGPISGGSMVSASVIPVVYEASDGAIQKLIITAASSDGPFKGKKPEELEFADGKLRLKGGTGGTEFAEVLKSARVRACSGSGKDGGSFGGKAEVSKHSFGAHFVEITWDEATARLRVSRVVSVIDAGQIINPPTARNQIAGAVVMGIGMALFEETLYDSRFGSPINSNLADYVVATNADSPRVDVHFLNYPDMAINALGARGVGEIGLAGIASAISNAVYHATGVRVRSLPIKIEDLLG